MHVLDYIRSIGFSITSGSQFMWNCYGTDAWYLESDDSNAVIDRKTGIVYEVAYFNEDTDDCLRWTNPDYIDAYVAESTQRGFNPWQAYDDVDFKQVTEQEIINILQNQSNRT